MEQRLTKEFYTINEIADLFSVTRATVYDWMNTGRMRYVIIGDRRRVRRDDLLAFIRPGEPTEDTDENSLPALIAA